MENIIARERGELLQGWGEMRALRKLQGQVMTDNTGTALRGCCLAYVIVRCDLCYSVAALTSSR